MTKNDAWHEALPVWMRERQERTKKLLHLLSRIAEVEKALPCTTPECDGRMKGVTFTPSSSTDDLWTVSNDCPCGVMGEFMALDEEAVALLLTEGWGWLRILHDHMNRVDDHDSETKGHA